MKLIITLSMFCTISFSVAAQNVGIGEASPTAMKLQVKSADSAVLLIQNSTGLGSDIKTGMYYKSGNSYAGGIATIGSGATFRMGFFTFGGASPSSLIERLSIMDGGNIGIGTNNAQYKLDVNGRARIRSNGPFNSAGIWYDKTYSSGLSSFVGTFNDSIFGIYGGGNWKYFFDHINNNFGINNSNPTAPLSFASTIGNKIALWGDATGGHYGIGIQGSLLQLYSSGSDADIAFGYGSSTSFSEKMRIKGNGNVGIGTLDPSATLHVRGSLRIADGTQGEAKVLTSDVDGNAQWTTPIAEFSRSSSFFVQNLTSQSFSGAFVPTILNTDNNFANGIYTVPSTGWYNFLAEGVFGFSNLPQQSVITIIIDNPNLAIFGSNAMIVPAGFTGFVPFQANVLRNFGAGTQIRIRIFVNGSIGTQTLSSIKFSGMRIN